MDYLKFSSYLTENTLHLHYKEKPVNAIYFLGLLYNVEW
jgi:hypothetical protein